MSVSTSFHEAAANLFPQRRWPTPAQTQRHRAGVWASFLAQRRNARPAVGSRRQPRLYDVHFGDLELFISRVRCRWWEVGDKTPEGRLDWNTSIKKARSEGQANAVYGPRARHWSSEIPPGTSSLSERAFKDASRTILHASLSSRKSSN